MNDDELTADKRFAQIDDEKRAILERNHFDADQFLDLRREFLDGELGGDANRIEGDVAPPAHEDVLGFPDRDSDEGRRLIDLGESALEKGEVGALILNGGMATRFGGIVKGCVEIFDELSFIGAKILDARRWNAPVLLMNSFATDERTREHLEEIGHLGHDPAKFQLFNQNVSIRLTPDGDLFREDGRISLYAPGHGDLAEAVGRDALDAFRDGGGKYLLMSNVDNTLATLDPLIVGAHIDSDAEMTVECVQTEPGYKGGMVARVDGAPQVVEHFRFPESFDQSQLDLLNTNTFCFTADALGRDFDLSWFVVDKQVDGQTVIQFERLAGELSAFLDTHFVRVPHTGDASRFLPVKTPDHLEDNRDFLRRVIDERGLT